MNLKIEVGISFRNVGRLFWTFAFHALLICEERGTGISKKILKGCWEGQKEGVCKSNLGDKHFTKPVNPGNLYLFDAWETESTIHDCKIDKNICANLLELMV